MWDDPIVRETRKIRDELAARFNYDVQALGHYYQSQQAAESRLVVKRPPKQIIRDPENADLVSGRV
jgi:hypothetical protein